MCLLCVDGRFSPIRSNICIYVCVCVCVCVCMCVCVCVVCVTGFWKTDQIVTLGLFHFIGPANGYTHTLHIHTAIIRLGWLVCFSRATFADPVNSWLGQWDPWRALHGRHGCKIHPRDRGTSITPFKRVWAYGWHCWNS